MSEVVIYTRKFCGYCSAAKRLLEEKGVAFKEFDASFDPAIRTEMIERTGGYTFPQIVIDGRPIGGCDDLYALERAGRLDGLLAERAS